MYKVSVVIPVYGVEKYIERCANSLFSQSLEDIQFIFVNDATKDNSICLLKTVINQYPDRKDSIKIINHEVNKGLPQARRTGIQYCEGEYIAHCDSDDWVSNSMYEKLYQIAKETDADIVYCDYFRSNGQKDIYVSQKYQPRLMQGPVWNKMVKRDIYTNNNIIYPVANKAEDGALMTQLCFFSKRISYDNEALYYYYENPNSMCRIPTFENCLSNIEQQKINLKLREDFLDSNNVKLYYQDDIVMWKNNVRKMLVPYLKDSEVYEMWKSIYPEIDGKILFNKQMRVKTKIEYYFIRLRLIRILSIVNSLRK